MIYQSFTMYLLLAIGRHGCEELAKDKPSEINNIAGFLVLGFVLNFLIRRLAYLFVEPLELDAESGRSDCRWLLRAVLGRNSIQLAWPH
ncbi:hypothetical protein DIJ64_03380 [Mycobacterium leprae]|uniref:Uncharacterized protein n=1 Tax=Mycobacterium leprae TaxID=1769 RepID=A0AAD0KQE2_MYCLR|nr:hypothetical protein DIJ64_03380 [Mycobacterium leprae]OAR21669.1 hypothetical protein A8144_00125 [Mycobacterium leprae 3125609]OAX72207.1 hypothetical protein A3216_00185 [Mycobacterium leprae 7935681]